ncbi:hypothetical protein EDB86DRAFT_2837984 [Lactarius hatsudake]|nr:hypothetical protein EDB86DRAFT_2837984 [Lactarius hatsudake]
MSGVPARPYPAPLQHKKRMNWFLENGPKVSGWNMANMKAYRSYTRTGMPVEVNGERHEVSYWAGSQSLECLVVIPTGAAQFVGHFSSFVRDTSGRRDPAPDQPYFFGRDINGRRALNGGNQKLDFDPFFRDYVWSYESRSLASDRMLGPGRLPYTTERRELSFTQDSEEYAVFSSHVPVK